MVSTNPSELFFMNIGRNFSRSVWMYSTESESPSLTAAEKKAKALKEFYGKRRINTTIKSMLKNDETEAALQKYFENPTSFDADTLISSKQYSLNDCFNIYDAAKNAGCVSVGLVVSILCECNDYKELDRYQELLDNVYTMVMQKQKKDLESINTFKWNTIITSLSSQLTTKRVSQALQCLHLSEIVTNVKISKYAITSLMNACCEVGLAKEALEIFQSLETKYCVKKDAVHYGIILKSLAKSKLMNEAMQLFYTMKDSGIKPDTVIYTILIAGCGVAKNVERGTELHNMILKDGTSNKYVDTALISMYSNFGNYQEAKKVFLSMEKRDRAAWNAIIHTCGENGLEHEAIRLFEDMKGTRIKPDNQTFVCVLNACGEGGLKEEASRIFAEMSKYSITPDCRHYGCLIKLYTKTKDYPEVLHILKTMDEQNIQPDNTIYHLLEHLSGIDASFLEPIHCFVQNHLSTIDNKQEELAV